MTAPSGAILWLKHVTKEDMHHAGEKAVHLSDLIQSEFPLPDGFVITSLAYFHFLNENKLIPKINQLLTTINFDHPESVMQVAAHIQKQIMSAKISDIFIADFTHAYNKLCGFFKNAPVTVHFSPTHSATSTLLQTLSNVHGESNLLLKIKQAWATLFTPEALTNRHTKHMNHFQDGIAVIIQKMVLPEKSGTLLTSDPVTPDKSKLIIETVDTSIDHYVVSKSTAPCEIVQKNVAGQSQKISDKQILALSELGKKLEKHLYFPQEIAWAIERDTLYIVQTKPLHMHTSTENPSPIAAKLSLLLKGIPASNGIATGTVRRIEQIKDFEKITHGDIVVASELATNHKVTLKKAAAFVTDRGGRTSPLAILAREWGIPAVVGTEHATKNIINGQILTVDGTKGEIYKGSPTNYTIAKNATRIYEQLSDLKHIDETQNIHTDGILIVHDLEPQQLTSDLAAVCKIFGSRPVIYRTSDPRPEGANPLIGLRGASRHLHQPEKFKEELDAIKRVRINYNCKNLAVMLPFVRSVHELTSLKHQMSEFGLSRSADFKLWMEIAIPSNIILLNEFIQTGIDGIAINIDTLTMLILGIDKDNSEIAHAFDATDPSILHTLEKIIKEAHAHGITTSIYGQALAHHSSLIEKVTIWGISSIAIEPDLIDQTKNLIADTERRLIELR